MPVHDWTRVSAGIFHHFHHDWIAENARALNRVFRGTDYYALAEQVAGGWGPDVLTLQRLPTTLPPEKTRRERSKKTRPSAASLSGGSASALPSQGGAVALAALPAQGIAVSLAVSPPKLRFRITDEKKWYAAKKKAVTIRHVSEHKLVAVLEILSPGNKASRDNLDDFVHKAHQLLNAGVHFALVDLFPPTRRDPEGIHPILWGDDDEEVFQFDQAKPLTCASYRAGLTEAFIEPVGIGDPLPTLPVFLHADEYVPLALEETYQSALEALPDVWRDALTAS
jgi:hypothetical protein